MTSRVHVELLMISVEGDSASGVIEAFGRARQVAAEAVLNGKDIESTVGAPGAVATVKVTVGQPSRRLKTKGEQ